ncbi:DUF7133 domain-containing protein [Planctomicrobium sp. SH668]|uniref:DUF7133 domain-containing protein n=1 Tax=Planctomicrobium sp. SH668 TaxID=3448126 RepID=UPI003F5BC09A
MQRTGLICLLVFSGLCSPIWGAERSATPAEAISIREGFQVELIHSAQPEEGSWISMTFDDKGRLILADDRNGLFRATLPSGNVPISIERIPGTDHLNHCRGVLFAHGALYVCATDGEGVYRLKDNDQDGTYEESELLIPLIYKSRYGHGANQIRLGPDGMIYIVIGNDVFFPENIDPASPYRNHKNDWLLPNPHDADQTERVGIILRIDPEGKTRTIFAGGLRNQVDVAFNSEGEMFTWDADMEWDVGLPWYRPTRINHVVSGGEYGWRWGTGKWPNWYPDSLPSTLDTGLGSPTGITFANSSNWPESYRNSLYAADWQNGRILRIDLQPVGASYRGVSTSFLEGSPVNVCDLEFGPDGSLYFITGGRGSQSGLYRVKHVGQGTNQQENVLSGDAKAVDARAIRHQLEKLHQIQDATQIEFIWSHLGSDDPWIRFAARVALENQDLDQWRKLVATAQNSQARQVALMALARVGAEVDQKIIVKGLKEWDLSQADPQELLLALRTLQLSLVRQGDLEIASRIPTLRRLHSIPPQSSFQVNWLLSELLVSLRSPEAHERILNLLEQATTQEEQVQYVKTLIRSPQPWTIEQRKRLLGWLTKNRRLPGGRLVANTLQSFQADFEATLLSDEREQLQAELLALNAPLDTHEGNAADQSRPVVQAWTVQDLERDIVSLRPQDHSVEKGRAALAVAICLRCHQFGDRGGHIGPDLTTIGKRFDGRALLESIIEPSKVIDPKYQSALYELEDGTIVSGRTLTVSRETIEVETNALTGKFVVIPRGEIANSRQSDLSPMPEGLLNTLSKEEILDLIAYLRTPQN